MVLSDPGKVEKNEKEILETVTALCEQDSLNEVSLCTTNMARRPLRSKYDKVSGELIARFDHYCPYMNNVIGYANHKYFIYYLLVLVINGFWSAYAITQYWTSPSGCNIPVASSWKSDSYIINGLQCATCSLWMTYLLIIDVGFCLWIVFGVLGEQFWNILRGQTTNESYNARR